MRNLVTVEKPQYTCDGCDYLMRESEIDQAVRVVVPFDYPWMDLQAGHELEFHFHTLSNRHDCFRYWAHNTHVMKRSLVHRGLTEDEIDSFMGLMLYRDDDRPYSPGLARPAA